MHEQTQHILQQWNELYAQHPGPVPYSLGFGSGKPHLLITACIHGNEVGSLPAMLQLAQQLSQGELRFAGRISLALGNPQAIQIDQRFVDEDLNRVFSNTIKGDSYEQKRARELVVLIKDAQYYIDLHQSIEPTIGAFYILIEGSRNRDFAKAVGAANKALVFDDESDQKTLNSYAVQHGATGFTLELSQKGYRPKAEKIATQCLEKAIDLLAKGVHSITETALSNKNLSFFKTVYQHKRLEGDELKKGIVNWAPIKKGDNLGQQASNKSIRAPQDAFVIFPKYSHKDKYLFVLAQSI